MENEIQEVQAGRCDRRVLRKTKVSLCGDPAEGRWRSEEEGHCAKCVNHCQSSKCRVHGSGR